MSSVPAPISARGGSVHGRPVLQPWSISLLLVSLLLMIPVLTVFCSIFLPSDGVWSHLYSTVLVDYVTNSLILMVGVGICVLVLGIGPAWLVTMHRFPGSGILEWALLLPLAMPAYIIAYTYTGLLDVSGPVQEGLRQMLGWSYGDYWFPEIRSLSGAVAMLSMVLYPYVYLLSRTAFTEQSVCVLEVSRTLGCKPSQAFFRVGLPLARPAIIAGLSLALMETLADYGTVQYFGVSTFTTGIFRTWFGLGSSSAAAQLSAFLMLFVLVLLLLENHSRRRARYHHTSSRYTRLPRLPLRGWRMAAAMAFCLFPVVFGFLVPASQLVIWSVQTLPEIAGRDFYRLITHSLGLAALSSVIAVLLALFVTYGKRLQPGLLSRTAVRILGLGYAVPGTVIAVGVLIPFTWFDNSIDAWMRQQFDVSTGLFLSGTIFALVFAYQVRFLPVSISSVEAGLAKVKPGMDEVSQSMGYGPTRILRRVHIPMLRGSLLTAALLVFVDVLKELPATLILRPFNFNTLAVKTYELANEERLADAAGPALMIVLAGIIPVILLSRTITRSRPGHVQRS